MSGLTTWALDNREVLIGVVIGLVATVGHYRRTGTVPLGRLPYRELRKLWAQASSMYFKRSRPTDVPALIVNMSAEKFEMHFRRMNFESGDLYSFEYEGEVLNLRQPCDYHPHPEKAKEIPSELHIRAFELADGRLLLLPHHEASRFEAWHHHINGTIFSWTRGQRFVKQGLSTLGVGYEEIESEEKADVTVVS